MTTTDDRPDPLPDPPSDIEEPRPPRRWLGTRARALVGVLGLSAAIVVVMLAWPPSGPRARSEPPCDTLTELPEQAQPEAIGAKAAEPERVTPSVPPRYAPDEQARSIGSPNDGSLENGIQIPDNPALYVRRYPPNMWASGYTIANLQAALTRFRRDTPFEGTLVVADASRRSGGTFYPPHRSHQSGRDVDLWLPMRPGVFAPERLLQGDELFGQRPNSEEVDWAAVWRLLRALADTGAVEGIFLGKTAQALVREAALSSGVREDEISGLLHDVPGGNPEGQVMHAPGHTHHLHVRFRCAAYEDRCHEAVGPASAPPPAHGSTHDPVVPAPGG